MPQFIALYTKFKEMLNRFGFADKDSKIITTGSTSDKLTAKQQGITIVVKISVPTMVYAINNGNIALHDQLNINR